MAKNLTLILESELWAFVRENCGDGRPFDTADAFVIDLVRQRMLQSQAAKVREAILEGYQDAIEGRTIVYEGNLRSLLSQAEK
ncbi:MAG: hypothetical protein C0478_04020 [Planctomyces sp.]|nr:hypothetical protein [Planctomyces sp.]